MTPNFEEIQNEKSEYFETLYTRYTRFAGRSLMTHENFIKAVKEVWNAAIVEAAENAKSFDPVHTADCSQVNKDSILKLKIE